MYCIIPKFSFSRNLSEAVRKVAFVAKLQNFERKIRRETKAYREDTTSFDEDFAAEILQLQQKWIFSDSF